MYFKVFSITVLICSAYGIISGRADACATAVIEGTGSAVTLLIALLGMLCFWNGISEMLSKSRIPYMLSHLFSPLTTLIVGKDSSRELKNSVSMLLCANLLGLGNAATPIALSCMRMLDTGKEEVSDGTVMLCVTSSAPPGILPMTVLTVLIRGGYDNPFELLPFVWICSSLSFVSAVLLGKIFCIARKNLFSEFRKRGVAT